MPYINIRTVPAFESKDIHQIAKDITESLSSILSKPVDTIMMDIQHADALFMGGVELNNGAFVEISVFGKASQSAKEEANNFLCKYLEEKLNISAKHIYITYFDKSEWGYKGQFISR